MPPLSPPTFFLKSLDEESMSLSKKKKKSLSFSIFYQVIKSLSLTSFILFFASFHLNL
ncbi:hypothetical protein CROQUDRAFT_504301 [Cronartium quercuum f. sp. fusiforme G11]|uniref:Transmembrane protein n=1 Tax=Cronartium quercuum f. sp. fusiforme G11 TaxID=708437 RepID=A0A9P6NSS0_9BASI|nr:hypothetical protein CROQUDRAFT_504301 [Cronartium quercuum f. sp. fusiforme G11]